MIQLSFHSITRHNLQYQHEKVFTRVIIWVQKIKKQT